MFYIKRCAIKPIYPLLQQYFCKQYKYNLFCLISLTRRVHFMPLCARHLTNIGHDILMRQADSFGQTSSAAGVRQECQVVDLCVAGALPCLVHTVSDHLRVASDTRWHGWRWRDVDHHHSLHRPWLDRLLYLADGREHGVQLRSSSHHTHTARVLELVTHLVCEQDHGQTWGVTVSGRGGERAMTKQCTNKCPASSVY